MKKLVFQVMILVGLIAFGCSSARVYSDYVQDVNFERFDSFAWLPTPDTVEGSVYENEILMQNIRSYVNREMFERGYSIDTKDPDLLVLVHTNFERREELVRTPIYSSYNYYYPGFYAGPAYPYYYYDYGRVPFVTGYDIRELTYTEGVVVVDIINQENNTLIWRGWIEETVDDPTEFREDVSSRIDDLFEEYPVDERG